MSAELVPCPAAGCRRVRRPEFATCDVCWEAIPADEAAAVYCAIGALARARAGRAGTLGEEEAAGAYDRAVEAAINAINAARGRAPQEVLDV